MDATKSRWRYASGPNVPATVMISLFLMLALGGVAGCGGKKTAPATPEEILNGDMTIYLKIDGGFYVLEDAWHFYMDTTKGAWFTVLRYPQEYQTELHITDEQLMALRHALIDEHFFELGDEYGIDHQHDLGIRGMRISAGRNIHSVTIYPLDDWDSFDAATKDEIQRALRIWRLVRSWFDAPAIVDYREWDATILASD